MRFGYDVAAARSAMETGQIHDWVQAYLKEPAWENRRLAAILHGQQPRWEGPVEVEFESLHRVAGPGPSYRYAKDPTEWNRDVHAIASTLKSPLDLPPLIIRPQPDLNHISDGNHRIDALRSLGQTRAWALLWHDRDPRCTGIWSPFAPESSPLVGLAEKNVAERAEAFHSRHLGAFDANTSFVSAEINSRTIGLLAFVDGNEAKTVTSIFVLPEYRNRLLGTRLVKHLAELGKPLFSRCGERLERLARANGIPLLEPESITP